MKIFGYRYLPLTSYLCYSVFVVFCFLVAPVEYFGIDYFVLIAYLAALILLFSIGYLYGAKGPMEVAAGGSDGCRSPRYFSYLRVQGLIRLLLTTSVIGVLAQAYALLASGVEFSLATIGANYVNYYDGYERGTADIGLTYILDIFRQAVSVLTVLFGIFYYRFLSRLERYTVILIITSYLFINVIGSGKQKYLGDVVIFFTYCAMINFAAMRRRVRLRRIAWLSIAAALIFVLFVEILKQRYVAAEIELADMNRISHHLITWDEQALIFEWLGIEYGFALGSFLTYFTQGLYGLYLSFTLPFEWTFFVGNSYSLGRITEIILGENKMILESTYPYRVGEVYGWGLSKWHSLFAWLASDVTFVGVLLMSPLFSYFYARVWVGAVSGVNAFSGPLFIYLSLGLVFSYANNQIMHGLAGVMVLLVLVLGWFMIEKWSRRKSDQNRTEAKSGIQVV